MNHITPEPSEAPKPSSAAAWAAATIVAMSLLVIGASLDAPDDAAAAQATAEHLAWVQGVAEGERQATEALAPMVARCATPHGSTP